MAFGIRKKLKNKYSYLLQELLPLLMYRSSYESKRWKRLQNQYQGQRCFIIGNGPSLKEQDLTLLKNEVTFVSNWFVLHERYQEIAPTFHCICAHEVFGTPSNAYKKWEKTVKFEPKLYSLLKEKANNTTKVFPFFFKKGIENKHLFQAKEVMYLFFEPPAKAIPREETMCLDIDSQRLYSGETVIINFCLPIAYYLGFKEIYLLGCDCDYGMKQPGDTRKYFYPSEKQTGNAPTFEWLQQSWSSDGNMMKSYGIAQKIFSEQGRTIYNATKGGKLEIFPRVNYESLSFKKNHE